MFGITGMPSSSNWSPGARSLTISDGGWPVSCISCINSDSRAKLSGSDSYTAMICWKYWYCFPYL